VDAFFDVFWFFGLIGIGVTFLVAFSRIGELEGRIRRLEETAPVAASRPAAPGNLESRLAAELEMFAAEKDAPKIAEPRLTADLAGTATVPPAFAEAPFEPAIVTPAVEVRPATPIQEPVAFAAEAHEEPRTFAQANTARARAAAPGINWELFAGGRLLNIIGAIVLVIGLGSLLKYAWDENWVSVPLRIAAGVIAGITLLGAGHVSHVRAKSKWFEQGLFGAGLGTLYASGYSAFAGYHLVPFALAYGFMSIVTIAAFALSVKYESLPMALIAWAGGFITPFAVSDGGDNAIGLASYIVLLDIGLLAVSLARRGWFGLQPLALGASYITAFAWYSQHSGDVTPGVSALALLSIWLVFFVSGVVDTQSEAAEEPSARVLLGRAAMIVNALVFWTFERQVLGSDPSALAGVSLGAAAAYAVAYALFVRRKPQALGDRLQYALGSVAMIVGATTAQFHHFELVTMLVLEGILASALPLAGRRLGADLATAREGFIAALAFVVASALTIVTMPDTLAFADGTWNFGFGERDLMLAAFAAGAFAIDRCTREALGGPVLRLLLRSLGLLALATLESVHFAQFELVTCYTIDAITLVAADRGLRLFGQSYAAPLETSVSCLLLLLAGIVSFALSPDAFALATGSWYANFSARDGALLALLAGAFVIERLMSPSGVAKDFGIVFRQIGLAAMLTLDAAHARDLGLATLLALEGVALVAVDRFLARSGRRYAPGWEPVLVATSFGAFGWLVFLTSDAASTFQGAHFALGFGHVDLALLSLAAVALVIERAYRKKLNTYLGAAFRLSAVVAGLVATFLHAAGFRLGEALSFEALILALIGTRTMRRDIEFAGFGTIAVAIGAILLTPESWYAGDIFRFVPFFDERFYAIVCAGIATFAAGEVYRRRSTLPPLPARIARILGIGLGTFAFTVEIRDIFELAIAKAHNELSTAANLELLARLVNGEGLAISAVWIAASIAVIAVGIAFRIKEFRIAAIALFDLTILKAFFIDLSSLATPYRIVSFIGLGLVLLGISYVYQRLERGFFDRGVSVSDGLPEPSPA
jgi:uncharacterized membrane protein